MRKTLASLVALGLVTGALIAGSGPAQAKKKKKGPVVVGTDPAGDWGDGSAQHAAVGDALGQDLISATIGMADKATVNFILKLNSLPPIGGTPEASRYSWNFTVDGEHRELDGKFTNFSRGTCDPTAGNCPPPRNPGLHPFLVRGECGVTPIGTINFTTCQELGLVEAKFDAAAATITIPVPLDMLGGKKGSKIVGAAGIFGGTISAAPAAWATFDSFPMDQLTTTKTFTVPKK